MPQRTLSEAEFNAIKDKVLSAAPTGLDEAGFQRWAGPAMAQAVGTAESLPKPPDGSALERFASGVWQMVNPMGLVSAVAHPIDTIGQMAGQQVDQAKQAVAEGQAGHPFEAAGHGMAAMLPILGPAAAHAGEAIAQGDVAGGLGQSTGLVAPLVAGGVIKAVKGANPRGAEMLERQAGEQVAGQVLAPGNPAYRGRAASIAPEILARKLSGGRAELQQAAVEGMDDAATKLDAAIQAAGGPKGRVPLADIDARIQASIADLQDSKGQPLSDQAAQRISALKDRRAQIRNLANSPSGLVKTGTVSFDDLKSIRDENYRISDEAKGYQRQGNPAMADEGWAARETGGAIRDAFAQRSPASASANADYAFWKTLDQVLDPVLGRPKNTAPSAGVTGGARTVGAVVGNMVSPKLAFVMGAVVPWIKERVASPAWQLADAQSKLKLAEAMRRGDVGAMKTAMLRIDAAAPKEATSPSESPSPTTAPVMP